MTRANLLTVTVSNKLLVLCINLLLLRPLLGQDARSRSPISQARNSNKLMQSTVQQVGQPVLLVSFSQNTSVNLLHVVLNQPGIFTKKRENLVPTPSLALPLLTRSTFIASITIFL